MEKTKYKLNYIQSHVKKSNLFKSKKKQKAKAQPPISKPQKVSLHHPKKVYRINHSFMCLSEIVESSHEYVSFQKLMLSFMHIKEIRKQNNFSICILEDKDENIIDKAVMEKKILASTSEKSSNLSKNFEKIWDEVQNLGVLGSGAHFSQKEYEKIVNSLTEPIIVYHHKIEAPNSVSMIRVNDFMKELTRKSEFEIFMDGLLLIPCKEYLKTMQELLEGFIFTPNQLFQFYLNTSQGVQKVKTLIYKIELEGEILNVFYFPKAHQSSTVQKLYENTMKRLHDERESNVPKEIPKKIEKKEDWEQLIKRYFENWFVKRGIQTCSYKTVNSEDN